MQKDRTARRALAPHPGDTVAKVSDSTQAETEPLSAAAAAALERLQRAFAPAVTRPTPHVVGGDR
jgi:hypothetical protein